MPSQFRPPTDVSSDAIAYDRLLTMNRSAILKLDADMRIMSSIGATQALFGHDANALKGQRYTDLIASDYQANIQQNITTQDSVTLDYPLIHADNKSLIWVHHNGEKQTLSNAIYYEFIIQDVSPYRNAHLTINHTQTRQRNLLNALPDMLLVLQNDGTITEFHTSSDAKSLQLDDQLIGKTLDETGFPQSLIDETTLYLTLELASYVHSIEFAQDSNNPRSDYYEARLVRLSDAEILILIRNVTTMKRVQDELNRHIEDLNLVKQVNIELSANLNVNYVSQLALDAALRLSNAQAGYLAMMLPTGNFSLMSQFGQYDKAQIERHLIKHDGILARALKKQQPELILNVHKDPDYIPLLASTHAMMVIPLHSNDLTVGILVLEARSDDRFSQERFQFLQLITGRIAAFLDNAMLHRQKEEQYEDVRQLEQLKTDMIRIANHDLKNPISAIMGYMELLRHDVDGKLSEKEQSYLDKIEVATQKMHRITTGILSLERIQQLSDQQTLQSLNLNRLVKQSIVEQMDFSVISEQALHHDLPDTDIIVQGDYLQLQEAVSNLIQNAIKYTPKHGTVRVHLERIDAITAQISIIDTGYGIPDNQKESLFAPFFRVQTRETRNIEGTGLGLHLVKNIIERHNGKMIFDSVYGEGSTFGFTLPIMLDASGD